MPPWRHFFVLTMAKKIFLLLVLSLSVNSVFAQQEEDPEAALRFREDQFYVGFAYTLGQSSASDFEQNGFSYQLDLGFLRDYPLTDNSKWAIAPGVGISLQRFISNLDFARNGLLTYMGQERNFNYGNLVFPLEFRWRNATAESFSFWRIHLGATISVPLWERNFDLVSALPRANSSIYLAAGYNTWNIYIAYQLQPFLRVADVNIKNAPSLINIGLRFYVL